MRSLTIRLMVLIVAVLLACPPLFAQTYTGRILGSVTDQTGAALTGATVVITDMQRGVTRTLTTDQAGEFVAPDLSPGVYKVHGEAKGFKSVERLNIQLEVAKDVRIDLTLQPGQVSETVVVSGELPLLDTTSSTLGGTLSNQTINDLPLSGRNYENLLQLRPGVIRYPGGGFSTTSTNGLRAEDNAYFIDGLFNSEPYSGQGIINGAGIAGDSATILPVDSIQEFNLQENPPAEYGWKPGAIVNVGLKSGTNGLHGTAFAFGRDGDVFDARNFFNCASNPCAFSQIPSPKNPRTLEQFGGSFGGPIIKDKAFFFGAYEGQRYDVGNQYGGVTSPSMVAAMPLTTGQARNCTSSSLASSDCAGSIPNAIADLVANNVKISPASLNIAGCTMSGSTVTCNGTGFPTNNTPTINVVNGFPNQVGVDNVVAKVDYNFSPRQVVSGMYFFGNSTGTVEDFPELQSKWRSDIHTRAQVVGGSWVFTPSARWVNEARFGYNRLYQPTLPGDLNTPASSYGLNTGVSGPDTGGLPRIGFGGYFFPGLGGFKWPKFQGPDSITQFIDHISYTAGKHAVKFGGEVHRNYVTGGALGNARGSITFLGGVALAPTAGNPNGSSALEDFFAGDPFKASVLTGNPIRQSHSWSYAGFVQDDWRVSRSVTLNLGVRYEFNTVLKEANNLLGNFDPNLGIVQVGKQISSPYNSDPKNFGPRLGFAWDMTGKGTTVLRAGGGLTYEFVNWQSFLAFNNSFGLPSIPTGAVISGTGTANPVTAGGTITAGNLSIPPIAPQWDGPAPLYGNLSSSTINCDPNGSGPCAIMGVDRNLTTPYVWDWTLNVQHAFTPNVTMEIAYVGNDGGNLIGIRDINQETPGTDSQATRPFNAKFPYLSNIFQMGNFYRSNYNGLQATLTTRNYHGLSLVAGYTYSHALDDVSANWDFGAGYGLPQNSNNVGAEYGNSDFDVRHRFTLALTYALPGKKGYGQMLEGWEINSIATLATPQYWGPIDLTTDISGLGGLPVSPPQGTPQRWDFFGNPSDFKSGPEPIPHYTAGNFPAACSSDAAAIGATSTLNTWGCYAKGNSVMIPPPQGQFGTMPRNSFPDSGFRNLDFSVAKSWYFRERMRAQFRAEFFNILNHPNFANPYGGQNGYGLNDPGGPNFGCGCATPDIAAANPAVGSGGPRSIQLGLKLTF
jgi:Carboxypeptidase regulatory-like domain